jgi:hypothetical protein
MSVVVELSAVATAALRAVPGFGSNGAILYV